MKIMVLNLPRSLTKEQLKELFQSFGEVSACDLVMDKVKGTSKGFGFVEMPDVAQANAAIAGLNGKKVENSKIRVKLSDQSTA